MNPVFLVVAGPNGSGKTTAGLKNEDQNRPHLALGGIAFLC
jgi:predicted ABC-type ATPase